MSRSTLPMFFRAAALAVAASMATGAWADDDDVSERFCERVCDSNRFGCREHGRCFVSVLRHTTPQNLF